MKILILSMEYPPETGGGGIGSYVASIAPALADRGHDIHVLSCVEGQKDKDYEEDGVHIHRRGLIYIPGIVRLGNFLGIPGTTRRLQTGLSTFFEYRKLGINFDVIEIPDWGAEGWLFALIHTKPLVAYLHTPLVLICRYNNQPVKIDEACSSLLEAFAVNRSDSIISSTNLLRKELRDIGWFKKSKVKVISYPVDGHKWVDTLPVKNTEPTVLFIGRLEQRKAPELVAQAFSIIQRDLPETKVLFVGKSNGVRDGIPYHEWLKKKWGDNINFQIFEQMPRNELKKILSKSRVLAMPSRFDSFGFVAAEAMAAGRPVVVSDKSGIAEFVKSNAIGQVVQSGDCIALSKALHPYLEDAGYAAKIGNKAKTAIRNKLDPGNIASQRERNFQRTIVNFKKKWMLTTRGFPYAIPRKICNLNIPTVWRNWLVSEIMDRPWKHFYLHTARQVLELIVKDDSLSTKKSFNGLRVLDVGCTPAVSVLLACLGANVVLLDNNYDELKKGIKLAKLLGVQDKIKMVKGDASKMPFKNEKFDLVWNSGFIEHFDNPDHILKQMGIVVKTGMPLIVLVPNRWTIHSLWIRGRQRKKPKGYYWDFMGRERSYSEGDLVNLLRRAGFCSIAKSSGNLRRSLIDDILILPLFERQIFRGLVYKLMNLVDMFEKCFKFSRRLGFMVGVLAKDTSGANS